jgi:hypothetical protein
MSLQELRCLCERADDHPNDNHRAPAATL